MIVVDIKRKIFSDKVFVNLFTRKFYLCIMYNICRFIPEKPDTSFITCGVSQNFDLSPIPLCVLVILLLKRNLHTLHMSTFSAEKYS